MCTFKEQNSICKNQKTGKSQTAVTTGLARKIHVDQLKLI